MAEDEVKIVLLGKTGAGKSSFANTFLGETIFEVKCSLQSQTQICKKHCKEIKGKKVVVVDTPGIFDTDRSEKELRAEIVSCLVECAPGPHVFILVLEVARHTKENQKAVEKLISYFGDEIFKHMLVLFTHGEDLEKDMKINNFINHDATSKKLRLTEIINDERKCNQRVHVIDNKHWNRNSKTLTVLAELSRLNIAQNAAREIQEKLQIHDTPWFEDAECQEEYRSNSYQLSQLWNSMEHILNYNHKQPYTNKCLEELGQKIKAEESKITQELENEGRQEDITEIRRRAIERVRTKLLRILAGVFTGTLLGAFLGLGVGIAAPAAGIAGLVRAGWRKLTNNPLDSNVPIKKTDKVAEGAAGAAVVAGVGAEIGLALGAEAAALGAGAATGIGAGIGAGSLLVYGAVKGVKCGLDVSKVSDNPNQSAKKVAQNLGDKAQDVLKACWNVGTTDTRGETKKLLNTDN